MCGFRVLSTEVRCHLREGNQQILELIGVLQTSDGIDHLIGSNLSLSLSFAAPVSLPHSLSLSLALSASLTPFVSFSRSLARSLHLSLPLPLHHSLSPSRSIASPKPIRAIPGINPCSVQSSLRYKTGPVPLTIVGGTLRQQPWTWLKLRRRG